jgi:predicted transcriptional regulator
MDKVNRKRDRLEVIYDILIIIQSKNNSIKPTPLLRASNLSSQNFAEYLKDLKQKNFLKEILDSKGRKHFTLTDDGFKYLEKYKLIKGFLEEFDL